MKLRSTAVASVEVPQPVALLPGLLLSFGFAALAVLLGTWFPVIGGPVFGILLGMGARASGRVADVCSPGIKFSAKQLLQASVILLGGGISLQQVAATGMSSLAVTLSTLVACLAVAWVAGRIFGISGNLTTLIGVGTAVCGASAIAATAPVIEAEQEEVAYSISVIFLFNVLAVLTFPFLGRLLGLSDGAFGLWAGTAVNDTSSVVAAAYSFSPAAGPLATVVKLTRTTFIIPIVLVLGAVRIGAARRMGGGGARVDLGRAIPWFVFGFLGASLLNTLGILPPAAVAVITGAAKFLIVVAMTAVGLSADFRQMARTGLRPVALGLLLWVTVAGTSLAVQALVGQLH